MSSATNVPHVEVISRSNVVTITDYSNTITGITYLPNSLMVTPGQPSSPPPTITVQDSVFTITLNAGRQGSSMIGAAFNSVTEGSSNEYAPIDGDGSPIDLNFYFGVTVEFGTGSDSPSVIVFLGQGSTISFPSVNNWWIGGSAISNSGSPSLEYNFGSLVVTLAISGTQDSFNFKSN
jgi:hypothetical protein